MNPKDENQIWLWAFEDGDCSFGPFTSVDKALQNATKKCEGGDVVVVFHGKRADLNPYLNNLITAESLVELLEDEVSNTIGAVAADGSPMLILNNKDQAEKELEEFLKQWVHKHIKNEVWVAAEDDVRKDYFFDHDGKLREVKPCS